MTHKEFADKIAARIEKLIAQYRSGKLEPHEFLREIQNLGLK